MRIGATLSELWSYIEDHRDDVVGLCTRLVQCPTGNPPGDTTAAVAFLSQVLAGERVEFEIIEPRPGVQSICAEWSGSDPGPTLVLNGHIDQFPEDESGLWTHPQFSGIVSNGRIYGRGVADMKGGVTASLYTFLLFVRSGLPLKGTLRLMLVADEETGGQWGTDWVLNDRPEWAGDACIIGEPTGLRAVRVGEKGLVWLALGASTKPYSAAVSTGEGPIHDIAQAVLVLKRALADRRGKVPQVMKGVVKATKEHDVAYRSKGWRRAVDHVSLNFGVIHGGTNINLVPASSEVKVDVRLPLGFEPESVIEEVQRLLKERGLEITVSPLLSRSYPANYTDPDHPFVAAATEVVAAVTGWTPVVEFSPTCTDARFFRRRGVPTILYGPTPYNIAATDEHIAVDDLLTVAKVYAGVAWRLLVDSGLP